MKPFFICFTENLNYALGWMVIHSLWQATIIAIVSGIIAISVRKKSPQLRYWIHNAALLSVLIAAIVTFCLYFDFSKEIGQTVFIPESVKSIPNVAQLAESNKATITDVANAPLSMDGLKMYFNRNIYLIVTIWVLGVALFILKLLGGMSYVYYLRSRLNFPTDEYWLEMVEKLGRKAGVKRNLELVESALVRSPLVVGHLKPMILFPIGAINKLNPKEVEAILAHEIAHVLRNDYVFNIIQSVIEALFYFHPAVWWISANIRTERENCCDDVAIALCGSSMTYAKALVSLQEMAYFHSPQLAMSFAGQQKNQLLFRVQRILKQPQNKTNVMEKLIATCLLLVLMVALSFGGNSLTNNSLADIKAVENTPTPLNSVETLGNKLSINAAKALQPKHFIKFKVNGVVDSFPVGQKVADGTYNYADNLFQANLLVKEHSVVELRINGSKIPAEEIKNHVGLINKIIVGTSNTSDRITTPQYNTDNHPVIAPIVVDMPTFSESNGDMIVKSQDGSQTVISHSTGDDNLIQVVTTTQPDGMKTITKTNKNGQTISETFDKKGKRITSNITSARGRVNVSVNTDDNGDAKAWSFNNNSKSEGLDSEIQDVKEEINDLKEEIKACECQTNKDFRNKLVISLDDLKGKLNKKMPSDALQGVQDQLSAIQEEWENGVCADENDKGSKGSKGSKSKNNNIGNSYSYGYGNSTAEAETARKDAETARKDSETAQKDANYASSKESKALRSLFTPLKDAGYIKLNKKCAIAFSPTELKVDNKNLTDTPLFNRIKSEFEAQLGKKSNYSIMFSGVIKSISGDNFATDGSLMLNFGN